MNLTKLKRNLTITIIGEILAKIPQYGFEFLLASCLLMDQYAEWAAFGLIYRLGPYAHICALSYFNKRYPVLLGKGKIASAKNINILTNGVINVVILCCFFSSLLLVVFRLLDLPLFMVICGILSMQIFTYCQAKVRNEGDFTGYTIGLMIFSIMQFIIAYFTIYNYGIYAGVFSTFIAYTMAVLYYLLILKVDYLFHTTKRYNLIKVLKMGFPPFLLTISAFLIQISDRVALVALGDNNKLAFYGFFALFLQIGIVIINSLGKVLGPQILHLSGNNKLPDTLAISFNTCYVILVFFIVITITLLSAGDWLIDYFFLKFSGGLLGVYNYVSIGIIISLTIAFYPQLIYACKEITIVKINICYFILSATFVYIFAKNTPGFFAYSFASFLMCSIYGFVILFIIEKVVYQKLKMLRYTMLFINVLTMGVNYYIPV